MFDARRVGFIIFEQRLLNADLTIHLVVNQAGLRTYLLG